MAVKICVLLLLFLNGVWDFRKQEIHLMSLGGFLLLGLGLNRFLAYQSVWELLGGAGIGAALLLAGILSREAIGLGDGLLLGVTGVYLGFWENLGLLTWGAAFCALLVGVKKLCGKVCLTDRIPFVPFLTAAYMVRLLV